MKILFDNNVPRQLRRLLPGHFIATAREMDWAELVNGQLLRAAEDAGFDVMLTADQSIACQQNLKGRKLALIVMNTNDWRFIREAVPFIIQAIAEARQGSYQPVAIVPERRPEEPAG